MSVTGFMYNINATKKLGELELAEGYEGHHSWHNQFKHSAYIYIGGLDTRMTEGDVVIVFSQFGEIIDVNLIRDRTTGKSKGFAFVCYEDQRSTILAVDNMNGAQLLNRTIRVDHVEKYKAPKKFDEDEKDEDGDPKLLEYEATGAEGKGYQVYNALDSQKKISEIADQKKKVVQQRAPDDADEAWAKSFEASLKDMGHETTDKMKKKKSKKDVKKEKEDLKKILEETKRLQKEAKKAKEDAKKKKEVKMERGVKSEESSSSSSSSSSSDESSEKPKKKKRKK